MINIVYTNSRCKDVLNIFKAQHNKHCKLPLFVVSDYEGDCIYKQEEPYYKHWLNALELIKEDYFIYNQEDFILYDDVQEDVLEKLKRFLIKNPKYSFARLLKSGQNLPTCWIEKNIYPVGFQSFPLYSMQATIWKKDRFVELYKKTKETKWFESDNYENACRILNIEGVYYYNGESGRGGHFDSSVYPYTATAVVRGKWNFSEYKKELLPLLEKHNIDPQIRGIF